MVHRRIGAGAQHAQDVAVGQHCQVRLVEALVGRFDWALNEQCYQYDECELLDPFVEAGKAVFGVEYTGQPGQFCPDANARGFSWLKKRFELDAWVIAC